MPETHKSSSLLGEALLDTIRLAVREEVRAALKEGGFVFDDRLISVNEAATLLHMPKDWLYRHASDPPFTRRLGGRTLRGSDRELQRWLANRRNL